MIFFGLLNDSNGSLAKEVAPLSAVKGRLSAGMWVALGCKFPGTWRFAMIQMFFLLLCLFAMLQPASQFHKVTAVGRSY